jgi:hypothetical protein
VAPIQLQCNPSEICLPQEKDFFGKLERAGCWTDVERRPHPLRDCRTVVGETHPELVETKDNVLWENSLPLIERLCGVLRKRVTMEREEW